MAKSIRRWAGISLLCLGTSVWAAPVGALTLNEAQQLLAEDPATGAQLGNSVAIDGNTTVIGAYWDDDNGPLSGSAYVFVRDQSGTWQQQAKLLPNDGESDDHFGQSVAVSGDTAVIGADQDSDNGIHSGAAYIFVRNGDGTWHQQFKLLPEDADSGNSFGYSLALSGDTALVGSMGSDGKAISSGAAYVFTRDNRGKWRQQAKLIANDGQTGDLFGLSVALSGPTAVIGAYRDDDQGEWSGSAYVFTRHPGGTWSQEAKLLASDGVAWDLFGWSVAVSGDTAVVGAQWDNDKGFSSGSAYVFTRDRRGNWTEQDKLLADDGTAGDQFGQAVAVSGDTAVVGAYRDSDNAYEAGSAYAFTRSADGNWSQQGKLVASDAADSVQFGYSVAVSGSTTLIGARRDNDNGFWAGSAYVFSLLFTPEQLLSELMSDVQALVDAGKVPPGLLAPLEAANVSLAQGNDRPAVNQIEAFIRQTEAMVNSQRLSEQEGAELIAAANRIIETIETE